jgi:hypothetical protein
MAPSPTYPLPERISACEAKERAEVLDIANTARRPAAAINEAMMKYRHVVQRRIQRNANW